MAIGLSRSFHNGREACFGIETPMGLKSTVIPVEKWAEMKTAKDLFDICGIPYDGEDSVFNEEDPDEENFDVFDIDIHDNPRDEPVENAPIEISDENHAFLVNAAANTLMGVRETVREGQANQAKVMLTRSRKYLCPVEIGDYVTLPIPVVDRSASSAPNIICRIVDVDYDKNIHELACEAGVLNIKFARNCFEKLDSKVLNVKIKLDKALSVREAASEIDIGGGQGMLKCNCKGECANRVCTCKKNNLLCNSRCHHNNSKCKNK